MMAAREAKGLGWEVVVVAIREEADPAVEAVADRIHWIGVGQLGGAHPCIQARGGDRGDHGR